MAGDWPVRAGRRDSAAERAADAVVLVGGFVLGLAGVAALALLAAGSDWRTGAALAAYAAGLLAMLTCSMLYNLSRDHPRRALLRRLDHGAIFVMIAGTYTPFLLVSIGGAWGWGLFGFVWSAAAAGLALKLRWPGRYERVSIAAYLVLGWCILAAGGPLLAAISGAGLTLLMLGGIAFSLGVAFHLWRRLPGQNAIWHGCVLLGSVCHYAAVVLEVVPRG